MTPTVRVVPSDLPLYVTEVVPDAETEGGVLDTESGARQAETFLLVHGYAASSFTWHRWRGPLARRGRVIQVDLKGFGRAPKPDDGRYRPRDLVDLLIELIRELDLSRLTLVGHSLGGGLSLLTSLRLLDAGEPRLSRLGLVAAPAYRQKLPPFVTLSKAPGLSEGFARILGANVIVNQVLRTIVHDPGTITEEQIREYAVGLESEGGIRAAMDVGRSIVPEDLDQLAARYPEIELPTFLLWGDHDPVVPLWVGERLAQELPRAALTVLPACGHVPPEEKPDESLHAFESFLDAHPLG